MKRALSPSRSSRRLLFGSVAVTALAAGAGSLGCSTHHFARVETSQLPPPPGERVLHTDRVVVHIADEAAETQCVAYDRFHPVCFYNIREALESGLARSLWPSFPEVVMGSPKTARPSDYLLQVEITLDALPPDDAGPGWSAGARSRFRVIREGKVIAEETLASRSRAQFPYGTPLGEGATEVIDATLLHIAQAVSNIPESRPDEPKPLPRVAANPIEVQKTKDGRAPGEGAPAEASSATLQKVQAKTDAPSDDSALGETASGEAALSDERTPEPPSAAP